jgi:hypothetical protein
VSKRPPIVIAVLLATAGCVDDGLADQLRRDPAYDFGILGADEVRPELNRDPSTSFTGGAGTSRCRYWKRSTPLPDLESAPTAELGSLGYQPTPLHEDDGMLEYEREGVLFQARETTNMPTRPGVTQGDFIVTCICNGEVAARGGQRLFF